MSHKIFYDDVMPTIRALFFFMSRGNGILASAIISLTGVSERVGLGFFKVLFLPIHPHVTRRPFTLSAYQS